MASFTTRIAPISMVKACENSARQSHPKRPKLDLKKTDPNINETQDQAEKRPPSNQNGGRDEIGTIGRLQIGIGGRLPRNTHIIWV
ncbi:hypothetical protein RFN25_28205 [Mesorhizobium abyssinicae]|uniref:hypothetical protein n=1 Tax=Mesorhizobium abyssinicae TaxID=1209958 RepID=UPI002A24BDA2|nr:hypothetical protein [Mesorhizobium abyssinicae]MDX8437291.1 hypothetical protein [Mesorhizobium abyssinicae]